jgi:hypothetical protein
MSCLKGWSGFAITDGLVRLQEKRSEESASFSGSAPYEFADYFKAHCSVAFAKVLSLCSAVFFQCAVRHLVAPLCFRPHDSFFFHVESNSPAQS